MQLVEGNITQLFSQTLKSEDIEIKDVEIS